MDRQDQGYVVIAANRAHYLELAVTAACSLKINDNRPVALLISGGLRIPKDYFSVFDWIIAFDPEPPFDGMFIRRFMLDSYTPFERSMHVDADCLLIGSDISRYWALFDGSPVGAMASLVKQGAHFNGAIDVGRLIDEGIAEEFYLGNWGVFYFEGGRANPVLEEGRSIFKRHLNGEFKAPVTYFSKPGQFSDEPIWGIALPRAGVKAVKPDYSNLLQGTSPNSQDHVFDFENKKFVMKKNGIPGVSGQFFHFCALSPLDPYLRGLIYFRRRMGVPLPDIKTSDGVIVSSATWENEVERTAAYKTIFFQSAPAL